MDSQKSDCGTQFVSQFLRELNKLLGIKTAASTAYHSQTDDQTECINQEIEQYLRLFVTQRLDDWYEWVSLTKFTCNNRIHSSTHTTLSGFFQSFPFWFPLLFFYPFLSPLLLTNQAPMSSIKGGTGTVLVLSLISEDIRYIRQVFVFILGYYKLRISAVPAGHYLLSALVFE